MNSVITVTQNQMGNLNTAWGTDLGGSLPSSYNLYGPTSSGGSGTSILGQLYGLQGPVTDPLRTGLCIRPGPDQRAPRIADELVRGHRHHARVDEHVRVGLLHRADRGLPRRRRTSRRATRTRSNSSASRPSGNCSQHTLAAPIIASFPYGGSFAAGGTVPGPPGMPVMIQAHGGEQVVSLDDQAGGHTFEIHGDPRLPSRCSRR